MTEPHIQTSMILTGKEYTEMQAEIERLRAEADAAAWKGIHEGAVAAMQAEITSLKAEVERMRKALEEIASGKYSGIVLTSFPPQDPAVNRARAALSVARAAIKEECARVADAEAIKEGSGDGFWASKNIAAAIRAME